MVLLLMMDLDFTSGHVELKHKNLFVSQIFVSFDNVCLNRYMNKKFRSCMSHTAFHIYLELN